MRPYMRNVEPLEELGPLPGWLVALLLISSENLRKKTHTGSGIQLLDEDNRYKKEKGVIASFLTQVKLPGNPNNYVKL